MNKIEEKELMSALINGEAEDSVPDDKIMELIAALREKTEDVTEESGPAVDESLIRGMIEEAVSPLREKIESLILQSPKEEGIQDSPEDLSVKPDMHVTGINAAVPPKNWKDRMKSTAAEERDSVFNELF